MKELNAQQDLFMEYLFNDPDCMRDTRRACVAAGYEPNYHSVLVRSLRDDILDRTNHELAMSAPKAAYKLTEALDGEGSQLSFKAVESVLDRVGIAKKQQMEVTSESSIPLFILPEKREVVIPDGNDDIKDC